MKVTKDVLNNSTVLDSGMNVSYDSVLEVYSGVKLGDEIEGDLLASLIETIETNAPSFFEAFNAEDNDDIFEVEYKGRAIKLIELELAIVAITFDEHARPVLSAFALDEIE